MASTPADKPSRARPTWWVVSVLLHTLLILVLLWAPVREHIFDHPAEKSVSVSEERIRKVSEDIIRLQREEAEKRLEELARIREEMEQINREKLEQYEEFQKHLEERAPERAAKMQEQAAELQESLMPRIEELLPEDRAPNNEESRRLRDTQTATKLEVERLQKEAAELLEQSGLNEAAEAQREAQTAQEEGAQAVENMVREALGHHNRERDQARAEEALKKAESQAETAQKNLASMQAQVEDHRKVVERHERMKAGQATEEDKKHRASRQDPAPRMQHLQNQANSRAEQAKRAEQALEQARRQAETARARAEQPDQTEALTDAARTAQSAAAEAQKRALEILQQEMRSTPAAETAATTQSSTPPPPEPGNRDISTPADMKEAVDTAESMELDILEQTRYARAMQEAALRRADLEQVLESTSIATPNRSELDLSALEKPATTTAEILDQRAALREASARIAAITAQAREHLASLTPSEGGMTVSVESLTAAANRQQQLRQLAAEDTFDRARDMVSALSSDKEGTGGAGAGEETAGYQPSNIAEVPTPVGRNPAASLPGRSVVTNQHPGADRTPSAPWLYVNTWYIIGPFPNPQRSNIDRRFPPEFVIDLDAQYPGIDDKLVGWRFHKSDRIAVVPPQDREYAIFYAYTELWFDEDIDLWVAIGSDDNSRIWVNDEIIWISSYELKGWRFDEGFRRIPFRKGRNRILYRLENGHYASALSFALYLGAGDPK